MVISNVVDVGIVTPEVMHALRRVFSELDVDSDVSGGFFGARGGRGPVYRRPVAVAVFVGFIFVGTRPRRVGVRAVKLFPARVGSG